MQGLRLVARRTLLCCIVLLGCLTLALLLRSATRVDVLSVWLTRCCRYDVVSGLGSIRIICWRTSYSMREQWEWEYNSKRVTADLVQHPGFYENRWDWRDSTISGSDGRQLRLWTCALPHWAIALVLLLISVSPFLTRQVKRRVRRRHGRCLHCGYDLRGTTESRCPECGIAFKRGAHIGASPGEW